MAWVPFVGLVSQINLSNASFPLALPDPRVRRALAQPLRRVIISHPPTPCTTSPPAEEQSDPPLSVMWRGKRKKSPNRHGTRSLLDIFPVRETIKAIPFPNDNNATKGAYLSSSSSTPSAMKTAPKKRPSRVAKKTVSYCNTNDEDGYELKKKAKANTTDSDSDEEATKQSTVTKSSAAVKSSVRVNERKLAAQPSTTGVVIELADKEKRATNKKIKEEVLQKNHQLKAELSVNNAFGQVAIVPIICSLASPEIVKDGGPKPL